MLTAADTAFAIAQMRAMEAERPASERLFDDPSAAVFAAAGAHAAEGTTRFLELPFFGDLIRLRTRFIDDFVGSGLAAGIVPARGRSSPGKASRRTSARPPSIAACASWSASAGRTAACVGTAYV